jgi:hypothetical protein
VTRHVTERLPAGDQIAIFGKAVLDDSLDHTIIKMDADIRFVLIRKITNIIGMQRTSRPGKNGKIAGEGLRKRQRSG